MTVVAVVVAVVVVPASLSSPASPFFVGTLPAAFVSGPPSIADCFLVIVD